MDGPRNYHAKWSQPDNETPTSNAFTDMWNLKKRTEWTSLQNRYWLTDFEKVMVSKGDSLVGGGDGLGLWDRNPIKMDCDDHCTTINVINSLSNKKIKIKKKRILHHNGRLTVLMIYLIQSYKKSASSHINHQDDVWCMDLYPLILTMSLALSIYCTLKYSLTILWSILATKKK